MQGDHKPGKLREFETCQNLRENSGKFEFSRKKPIKHRENEKYVTSIKFPSLELLREKFLNALEISGKTQGI